MMRAKAATRRAGFTLVEVLVALAVGGVAVGVAHHVFVGVSEGGRALSASRQELDHRANAGRWLKAAIGSIEVGPEAGTFEGHGDRLTFSTWTQVPGLWFEQRRVTIALDGDRLMADQEGGPLALAEHVSSVAFDYLLEAGERSAWVREWRSAVSAPFAVRARITYRDSTRLSESLQDTLLLVVGVRG